jgi:hypothetical protein
MRSASTTRSAGCSHRATALRAVICPGARGLRR